MFLNWFRSETRAAASDDHHFFVEKIRVRHPLQPVDTFVVVGWALILAKCGLASVAIHRWQIPVHDIYVWGPSVFFGAVCTWLYLTREEK